MNTLYFTAKEVAVMLGVSRGKAYGIIKELNCDLEKEGYLVVAGKVPRAYFASKYYGGIEGNLSVNPDETAGSECQSEM